MKQHLLLTSHWSIKGLFLFRICVETPVYPTEDIDKVVRAILNLFSFRQDEIFIEKGRVIGRSNRVEVLDKFFEQIRKQRILDTTREILMENKRENKTIFLLNKQVAFIGKVSYPPDENSSPLGPVSVEIECSSIDRLIDWLAPYTISGKPVKLVEKPLESSDP